MKVTFQGKSINIDKAEVKSNNLGVHAVTFKNVLNMVKDIFSGKYIPQTKQFYISACIMIIYIINPFDCMPDFLPFVGYVDDIAVFSSFIKSFSDEIEAYNNRRINKIGFCKIK